MNQINLNDIHVTRTGQRYCRLSSNSIAILPHKLISEEFMKKRFYKKSKVTMIYGFWVNENNIFATNTHISIAKTHSKHFKKMDLVDIIIKSEFKSVYEKGYVKINISSNQEKEQCLWVTRGDYTITEVSMSTIKKLADILDLPVYYYDDPSNLGKSKSHNDDDIDSNTELIYRPL